MTADPLRLGPLGKDAVHVSIDMQRLFAEHTDWATPRVHAITPTVARITAHAPYRTIFTRFLTPAKVDQASGHWKVYYQRWQSVLASNLDADVLDLVPDLRPFVPPATVVDKITYSAFQSVDFTSKLETLAARTLIFTGVESDVCVLATVLGAVDRGMRVVLVSDAIASASAAGHEAAMGVVYPRYDMQIETISSDRLLEEWKP